MLPPATRPQDVPTPPIPPVAAQPPDGTRIRPDGQPHRPADGAGGTAEGSAATHPAPARTGNAEAGADAALAEEHERALGRGRLIDVLG